jgi:hypothetical protein
MGRLKLDSHYRLTAGSRRRRVCRWWHCGEAAARVTGWISGAALSAQPQCIHVPRCVALPEVIHGCDNDIHKSTRMRLMIRCHASDAITRARSNQEPFHRLHHTILRGTNRIGGIVDAITTNRLGLALTVLLDRLLDGPLVGQATTLGKVLHCTLTFCEPLRLSAAEVSRMVSRGLDWPGWHYRSSNLWPQLSHCRRSKEPRSCEARLPQFGHAGAIVSTLV